MRTMRKYVTSKNIPGYLPMDDDPFVSDSGREAAEVLLDDLDSLLGADEEPYEIQTPTMSWSIDADTNYTKFLEALRFDVVSQMLDVGEVHVWTFDKYDSPGNLGLHWWVVESEDDNA